MKKFWLGLVLFGLVVSCPQVSSSSSLSFEFAVGTMNSLSVNTLFVVKVRQNNQPPAINATVTLGTVPEVAPTRTLPYIAGKLIGFDAIEQAPKSGIYNASVQLGSETATAKATLSNGNEILPQSTVTANNATVSNIPASWTAVPGAYSYQAVLFRISDGKVLAETPITTSTNVTFAPSLPLDATKIYLVIVSAYSANLADPNVSLSGQVNASSSSGQVKFQ